MNNKDNTLISTLVGGWANTISGADNFEFKNTMRVPDNTVYSRGNTLVSNVTCQPGHTSNAGGANVIRVPDGNFTLAQGGTVYSEWVEIITNSDKKHPLLGITSKNATLFHAQNSAVSSRKQWLLNHLHPSGSLIVDDGAIKAIKQNKSLLPTGVIDIKGKFSRGDIITILATNNNKIGIGVSAYDVSEAKKIMGKNSRDISKILGYEGRDEIIHKDDLVKFSI